MLINLPPPSCESPGYSHKMDISECKEGEGGDHSHLMKLVIPHNSTAIHGELLPWRTQGVHPSNLGSLERLVGESYQADEIKSSCQAPIHIKIDFFPSTIVKVDVSQKRVKLEWERNIEQTMGNGLMFFSLKWAQVVSNNCIPQVCVSEAFESGVIVF